MKRSREQFRWARERWRDSERLTEPSLFHQVSQRWDTVARHESPAQAPTSITRGLPLYWQKANTVPKK